MRCKACNIIINPSKVKQDDGSDEDLCNTCLGLYNPPPGEDKPKQVSIQEQNGGFKVGWY